jgi:hypothetical protein
MEEAHAVGEEHVLLVRMSTHAGSPLCWWGWRSMARNQNPTTPSPLFSAVLVLFFRLLLRLLLLLVLLHLLVLLLLMLLLL